MTMNGRMGALHMRTIVSWIQRAAADRKLAWTELCSQGHEAWRAWELGGELWSSGERSGTIGRLLAGRESEPCTHCNCCPIGAGMGRCSTCVFGCVCSLWVPASQAQVRVVIPMRGTNLTVSTMHGDSR